MTPRATYRLQFNRNFTFKDAQDLVPYLNSLGISHIYASPFFLSAPGSLHGYDVFDHNQFNPEIGTAGDFAELSEALKSHGMSVLLDFVPNHMGISGRGNRWWFDVLEKGKTSLYARYFDIDWEPPQKEMEGKVLLPILGSSYGDALEKGELQIVWEGSAFELDYLGNQLPLSWNSQTQILKRVVQKSDMSTASKSDLLEKINLRDSNPRALNDGRTVLEKELRSLGQDGEILAKPITNELADLRMNHDRLDELLSQQNYRLSHWKVATEEINYRRFFDVNSLAALRVEDPDVFADIHRLLFDLIEKKLVTGVRVDHIDGLALPRNYLEKFQEVAGDVLGKTDEPRPIWLLVEKILAAGEELPEDWPVDGTTGYDFANHVAGLLIDPAAENSYSAEYRKFAGGTLNFAEEAYRGKRLVMEISMAGEVNTLSSLLRSIAQSHRSSRDYTLNSLTAAVRELIACFPVYRSYLEPGKAISEIDRDRINQAFEDAERRNPNLDLPVLDFLKNVLLPDGPCSSPVDEELRQKFVLKFQQCTGPIMARGLEDTAFYVYNRFVARNEVGSDPGIFSVSAQSFHNANLTQLKCYPLGLLATATHDTKRSEDVRARLAALSEVPREWNEAVDRWHTSNIKHRQGNGGQWAPDRNEEYLIYQTLVGSWPLESMNAQSRAEYVSRIQNYMIKALHEGKVNSGWIDPDLAWDQAVTDFVGRILQHDPANIFTSELESLVEKIAFAGCLNSLVQIVLKMTSPGVPDFYQGTELWDWSLVDPDNRRSVDFSRRKIIRETVLNECCQDLVTNWKDGRIKMFVIVKLLQFRKKFPTLFSGGDYIPLEVKGEKSGHVCAFLRREGSSTILIVVPLLSLKGDLLEDCNKWGDTEIVDVKPRGWVDLFTNVVAQSNLMRDIFKTFPVVVFFNQVSVDSE